MKTSDNGIRLIRSFEGFSATPYQDICGNITVGYGHKLRLGEMCDEVSQEIAIRLLTEDLLAAEKIINSNVKATLNQNQFDALVSFVFNIGPGITGVKDGFVVLHGGRPSTLLTKLNDGDFTGAAGQFPLWDHAGGQEIPALRDRRLKEQALFLTPVTA